MCIKIIRSFFEQKNLQRKQYGIKSENSKNVLQYISVVKGLSKTKLFEFIESFDKSEGKIMMTFVEEFIEEGVAIGRQEGVAIGRQEGISKGKVFSKQQTLIRQMTRRFGSNSFYPSIIKKCSDLDKLDAALDEIIFATTVDEVLAHLE